jgi:Fic family protein
MNRNHLAQKVREQLVRYPAPHDHHYGVVPLAPPEDAIPIQEIQYLHDQALHNLGRIQGLAEQGTNPHFISRTLSRREAIESSAIEGIHTTLLEFLAVEEEDDAAKDAVRQVKDYALILDRLLPRAGQEGIDIFTVDLIQNMHRDVMRSDPDYPDTPGEFKQVVNWIGGRGHISTSTYNPAPPSYVPACLEETASYLRCEGMQSISQSLIARMAIAHAHFEAIHPFRDGNGRVGRLLLPIMMAAENQVPLYLSPYISANRQGYYEGLKAAQQRLDYAPLIGYFSEAISSTVEDLLETHAELEALKSDWRQRRKYRAGSASFRALDLLMDYPVITLKRLALKLEITPSQALKAINQLLEIGVIVEHTGFRRNRIFVAEKVIEIVNRSIGEEIN